MENRNNTIQNDNISFDRRSLQFNIKRIQTLNNNIFSPIKTQTTQIKKNSKVNQTETKLNIKYPSLGLGNFIIIRRRNIFCLLRFHFLDMPLLVFSYTRSHFNV